VSRLAHSTLRSGTKGPGDTPGGGEEMAGIAGLGVGDMVTVRIAADVAPPEADGARVAVMVRVEAAAEA
jgi:hypothetical protein